MTSMEVNPGSIRAPGVMTPAQDLVRENSMTQDNWREDSGTSWVTDTRAALPDSYSMYEQLMEVQQQFTGGVCPVLAVPDLLPPARDRGQGGGAGQDAEGGHQDLAGHCHGRLLLGLRAGRGEEEEGGGGGGEELP